MSSEAKLPEGDEVEHAIAVTEPPKIIKVKFRTPQFTYYYQHSENNKLGELVYLGGTLAIGFALCKFIYNTFKNS